ncbi:MAG: tetratricopeptide repeat protein [Anaerolineales bacterium]|nr:tetratricopeptide repeat protein [Anaerolineales bacterium]
MTDQDSRYQSAMSQGHSAAWDQEWDNAASFYQQALADKPDDAKALNSLALAYYQLRDFEQSLRYYLQSANVSPDDPLPLEKAATLYEALGRLEVGAETAVRAAELYLKVQDIDKAVENWSRAIGMNPQHLRAHSRLAIVYEKMGRKPQAVREYLHIASLMQHAGDMEKAVQSVNRALKIGPQSEEAQQALVMLRDGHLLPKPGRPRGDTGPIRSRDDHPQLQAPQEPDDAGLDPIAAAQQMALGMLAELFFDQPPGGEEQEAGSRRGFQNIVMGTGPLFSKKINQTQIMLHLSQAVESQMGGDQAQAAEELKRAIDAGLDHLAAFYALGLLRLQADRLESAVRYLQRSVQHPAFSLGSRLLLGSAFQKMGRSQEAAIEYLEALRIADAMVVPSDQADGLRQLYEPLIQAQSLVEDEQRNLQLCESVAELLVRPQWRQHLRLMRSQSLAGFEESQPTPLAEVLTEARSSQVVLAMNTVRSLAREGRKHAALEEALYALQHAPTYLPLHITIGDLLVQAEQIPEAMDKFIVVARAYSVRGESGRAIEMLRRVVEMAPMNMDIRLRLIDQLTNCGDHEAAIQEYIHLAEVYYNLAELTNARKTYAKALRLAQISDVDIVWRVRVLHRIADIDVQGLDWRQATQIYQEICTIKPDDQRAWKNLINLNVRMGELAQATKEVDQFIQLMRDKRQNNTLLQFLEEMVEEHSDQAMLRRRLAEQYHLMERKSQAIEQLDQVGEILLDSGDKMGAMAAIQRIIELEPDNVQEYRQLINRMRSN